MKYGWRKSSIPGVLQTRHLPSGTYIVTDCTYWQWWIARADEGWIAKAEDGSLTAATLRGAQVAIGRDARARDAA